MAMETFWLRGGVTWQVAELLVSERVLSSFPEVAYRFGMD